VDDERQRDAIELISDEYIAEEKRKHGLGCGNSV
jgi:hypothetical protein